MTAHPQIVDATGLNCPLPILRLKKASKDLAPGGTLRLLSTDTGSVKDVEAFCRQTGCELLSAENDNGIHAFTIRKGA
ncbi:sulfurtransferase TusA family protein [Magnetospira sp. QH-2]|uniref:sulfurtransferase TusA family protein n=1 Tax=Magnetospira sp. (strain QH-2) TaxID=1288970 RepID=UPI0003E81AA5|nr:sulfurtransferase TusA family protein [Magnetospira sp. QH-2]CCQ73230.1 Putative sulfurtransferase [Magnetospira sp. QH-2]